MPTSTTQLDRLEESLPPIQARIMRLQRTIAGAACDQVNGALGAVADAARTVLRTADTSRRTVSGQAHEARRDITSTIAHDTRQVSGQAKAQARRVSATAGREATGLIDAAIDAVDPSPGSGKPYEQWTKAELLDRAKELGVEGRYGLNKRELIAALRRA